MGRVMAGRECSLSREEFEREYTRAYPTLHVIAAVECGRNDAEDAVQEAVIIAMKKLDQFTPGTNFTAWMASIVRGVASNTRRGERRRRDRVRRLALVRPRPDGDTTKLTADDEVLRALERLPNEQRLCLTLKAALSHSYKEIAEATGISEATARSHVFRARRTLLDTLPHKDDAR